ncbi:hypothetical protein IU459_27105 [Nocardia amamiensis]|uniref:Uncharacterized protein n=1 Tax=Nocardia amamiensis TaxID=404578 RepID=A0ABS0CXH8_9NOCA|nr:hypothetical protein [Nocardia amamiensis]MBF6301185.1 hypothetical protein [Nocardia amamiensis]
MSSQIHSIHQEVEQYMAGIHRTLDFETFTLAVDLPTTAQVDIETRTTGSRDYLAGQIIVDAGTISAYLDDCAIAADRFLRRDDGSYIRITGGAIDGDGGVLYLDQSRETLFSPPEGGDPVLLRVVEPDPPTTPMDWFFDEVARAFADLEQE